MAFDSMTLEKRQYVIMHSKIKTIGLLFLLYWRGTAQVASSAINIFVVNTTSDIDDGTCDLANCSLREAINAANTIPNDSAGPDEIHFNIAGGGVQIIQPTTELPTITKSVVIDGYTQPGSSPNTLAVGNDAVLLIALDGTLATSGTTHGILISHFATNTVRGLVIGNFSGYGIFQSIGSNNIFTGNFIGVDPMGTVAAPNGFFGIFSATVSGSFNRVGGPAPADRNVISGNMFDGLAIGGNGTVQGNYIGTNAAGTMAIP
ncbi:MAG: CSLREA domain-containing protein, partial [Fulvimarina manganoxydans]|uniref:CSLREA domain-containing protein n=1 Tax=Fulvimarina manganoxydans TaxID=937218 RepID=UPI00235238C2